jgi:hypothetical protein
MPSDENRIAFAVRGPGDDGFFPWPAPDPANVSMARTPTESTAAPTRPNLFTMLLSLVPLI